MGSKKCHHRSCKQYTEISRHCPGQLQNLRNGQLFDRKSKKFRWTLIIETWKSNSIFLNFIANCQQLNVKSTLQINSLLFLKESTCEYHYGIVASTNMCYYSENQIFWFLKSRIVTCRKFFLGTKLFCLLSKWAEKKDTWQTHDVFIK